MHHPLCLWKCLDLGVCVSAGEEQGKHPEGLNPATPGVTAPTPPSPCWAEGTQLSWPFSVPQWSLELPPSHGMPSSPCVMLLELWVPTVGSLSAHSAQLKVQIPSHLKCGQPEHPNMSKILTTLLYSCSSSSSARKTPQRPILELRL